VNEDHPYATKLKLAPRKDQISGRTVIFKPMGSIVSIDMTKATKFVLIDAVGPSAEAEDLHAGDVILPQAMGGILLDQGFLFRPYVEASKVAFVIEGVTLDDLLVQTENGKEFVPFDAPNAAKALVKEKKPDAQPNAA
jgi:hypothetical protein